MKKLFAILLSLCLMFSIFAFAGCSGGGGEQGDGNGGGGGPIIDDGGSDDDSSYEDDGGEVDTSRFDTPETGFTIDGTIDATEAEKYNTLGQRYGVEGQVIMSYYVGDKGIYFHFDVTDPKCFKGASEHTKDSSPYIMDSDRIEVFIDTEANGGSSPMADDYHIMMTLEGYNQVLVGTGSNFKLDTTYGLDACVAQLKQGTTVSTRDDSLEAEPNTSKNVDPGYTIEAFMSYSNFEFSKLANYKMSVASADMWSAWENQRFNCAGSNTTPSSFRSLTQYGFGTEVALELEIDGQQDDFYNETNVKSNENLYFFEASRNYKQTQDVMTTHTYLYSGEGGIYVYMNAFYEAGKAGYLTYYYSEFPYTSDHVEIRFDCDNNENYSNADRWFFIDILGAVQTAYGIDNDNRSTASYDLIATTQYTGILRDSAGRPSKNDGSTDPCTFTVEAFFPWTSLGVASGSTIGMILECGNPDEGATGIGNTIYAGSADGTANRTNADIKGIMADAGKITCPSVYTTRSTWHTFLNYNLYTKIAVQ